jgi:hypothetical protein
MEELAEQLAGIPGVVAVTLGGSRARGEALPDSDWDFGLYYRGAIDIAAVRSLGHEGVVVEPGAWGRLVNGGAWLTIDGQRVDLLYRDLDVVEHWQDEAERGRFEVDQVPGFLAGMATYVLVGELALAKTLVGSLPRPDFPEPLRTSAGDYWLRITDFTLGLGSELARRGDRLAAIGTLLQAAVASAQARLAARGEWALNEKRILERAGFHEAVSAFNSLEDLEETAARLSRALVP